MVLKDYLDGCQVCLGNSTVAPPFDSAGKVDARYTDCLAGECWQVHFTSPSELALNTFFGLAQFENLASILFKLFYCLGIVTEQIINFY